MKAIRKRARVFGGYPEEPLDAKTVAEEQVRDLLAERDRIADDKRATPATRQKLQANLNTATRLLAKLTGSHELTQSQIVRSRHWVNLMAVATEALRPYPEALRSLITAVQAYDDRGE